ncbi:MAG: MtrB/PioB family outer membrane beta-barrel protein, partial [Myxococcota bacterium]
MRARQLLAAFGALALVAAGDARAQVAQGDVLNPSGGDPTRTTDPRGMSHLLTVQSRSPAGFLYPNPLWPNQFFDLGGGWSIQSAIEFGGLWTRGDVQETRFGQFADWSDNVLVEFADLTIVHDTSGFSGEFVAGRIAADDQHYRVDLGIPGLWRLVGGFSGVPHVFATDAISLYEGAGTDVLRLRPPLEPGFIDAGVPNPDGPTVCSTTCSASLSLALANTSESTLSIQRDRSRLLLEFHPLDSLSLFARYALDESEGERPFGGSILFAFRSDPAKVVETIEPRDYRTHDFSAGLRYRSPLLLANLEYNGSLFRNSDSSLTWDNPFAVASIER